MKKQNIFLDLDGLKFDTLPALALYMNDRYGLNSTALDYVNKGSSLELVLWDHRPDLKHISRDAVYLEYGKNFASSIKYHENVLPMKDMCEVVSSLSKKYTLYTVTARQKSGIHVIQYLLEKHIPKCITDIHCVWEHKNDNSFSMISKKDFIKTVSGKHAGFLDDSLHEVEDMQDFMPSYLFDPDGLYKNHKKRINRVETWKEIGDTFL